MIFQAIDDKNECIGVYADGKLSFDNIPKNLTKTWKYSGSIKNESVEYAWLYTQGKNLEDCCPDELAEQLANAQKKFRAFIKSFEIAKVNLNEHCFFDLIPHDFLLEFCSVKNKITEHVFNNYEKPANYEHLNSVQKLLHKLKYQKLNIKTDDCRELMISSRDRQKIQSIMKGNPCIDYNLFGTVTGRLTTNPGSFPILTLKKEHRKIIKPTNDLLVSLDYNGAEVRTLLQLCEQAQPQEDIHSWNAKNLFEEQISRDDCKLRFFAWLYNPDSDDIKTDVYDKQKILDKHYKEGYIYTPYNRKIRVEPRKALNYLIQSTTSDRVLEKAVKINTMLVKNNCKSFISAIIHDEVIIDYCDEDRSLIEEIKEEFEDNFMANMLAGKNLYSLEEVKI